MKSLHYIFVLLVLFTLPLSAVFAQAPDASERLVNVRLLAERGYVQGGDEIWIGLEQNIAPHWHTYWKNPGDSGAEPRIEWILPEGFEMGDIHWPAPHKLPYEPLLNYGYEDSVILLQKLSVPQDIPSGAITLVADFEVLVCEEECIPEYGTYELTLNGEGARSEDNAAYLAQALASVPVQSDYSGEFVQDGTQFIIDLKVDDSFIQNISDEASLTFFPVDWGVVENAADADIDVKGASITIEQPRGERELSDLDGRFSGVLTYTNQSGALRGIEFSATSKASPKVAAAAPAGKPAVLAKNGTLKVLESDAAQSLGDAQKTGSIGVIQAFIFAILGGIILNLMPCVFPVLSMKALSLVKSSEKEAWRVRAHGLAYTAGIILSFLTIAGILIALQSFGSQIGWGFQLQNSLVVSVLVYVFFLIGLNLSGYFEIPNALGGIGQSLTQGEGVSASFFTGILAAVVATPCTAPFMAGAIGFALTQPLIVSFIVFAALGFGLALPYLLLCYAPSLQRFLPKPGAWMDTFKQFLAFPMYLSVIWLLWVLGQQVGQADLFAVSLGAMALLFAIWLFKSRPQKGALRLIATIFVFISLALSLWALPYGAQPQDTQSHASAAQGEEVSAGKKHNSSVFSVEALDEALATDQPVFVEMTAAWCITCKVNNRTSINIQSTRDLFAQENVKYLIGDWTNYDGVITQYLEQFGRNGVPIYVYYGAPDASTGQRPDAKLLPQILTPSIMKSYIGGR